MGSGENIDVVVQGTLWPSWESMLSLRGVVSH